MRKSIRPLFFSLDYLVFSSFLELSSILRKEKNSVWASEGRKAMTRKRSVSTAVDKDIGTETNLTNNSQVKHAPDGLPHGWIKEYRFRKPQSKVKKDPYYIDPVSGYMFRSLKDVFRYIQTGDITQCILKPKKRSCSDTSTIEKEFNPSAAAKRLGLHGNEIKRCLSSDENPDMDEKMKREINESSNKSPLAPSDDASNTTRIAEDADFCCRQMVSGKVKGIMTDPRGIQQLDQMSGLKNESYFGPATETQQNPVNDNLTEELDEAVEASGPSKILEEKPHEVLLGKKNFMKPGNKGLLDPQVEIPDETKLDRSHEDQSEPNSATRGRRPHERKKKKDKGTTMPVRASQRLAALKTNSIAQSGTSCAAAIKHSDEPKVESAELVNNDESNQNIGRQNETSQVVVEASEDVNCKKPKADKHKQADFQSPSTSKDEPPFTSLFGGSWPDPCIEFAFKTLTGDIPILGDFAAIESYFQKQLSANSSRSLHTSSSSSKPVQQFEDLNQKVFSLKDNEGHSSLENGLQSSKKINRG